MADNEAQVRARVIATGRKAANSLGASTAGKAGDEAIETNIASLRGLSEVIAGLVAEADRCSGTDCMGRSVDGIRLWVTRDRFEAVERRAARLEAALNAIALAGTSAGGEYDMFVDWQGTVTALTQAARRALDDSGS